MTDRFDEMAGRVQMDIAVFAMPTGTSARRVIADALRAAHAGGVDEAAATIDLSMDDARELRRLALLGLERDTRAERVGRAVLDALVPFTHPAYGTAGTLRGMATILRKTQHGPFEQTPALLDAIADAMEDET